MAGPEPGLSATAAEPAPGPAGGAVVVLVIAVAVTVLGIYATTLASMAAVWSRSDTFAHGFLILPLAAWLVWRGRYRAAQSGARAGWMAAPLLAGCVITWLAGTLLQADVVRQFAAMAMIPVAVTLVLGPGVGRALAFPLLFVLLAVPAGEFLIAPMMDLTAWGSVGLLLASGVPVFRDGWLISIPAGEFLVADACSGVRYLAAAVTSGVLFAALFFRSWNKRIFFMIFVVFLTVMANVLRAYIIILLAHLTEMRLAAGVDHFIYGWLLFSMLLLALFGVGARFADQSVPQVQGGGEATAFARGLENNRVSITVAMLFAIAVMSAGPVAAAVYGRAEAVSVGMPARVGGARLQGEVAAPEWLRLEQDWSAMHLRYAGPRSFDLHVIAGSPAPGGRDLVPLREQLAADAATLLSDDDRQVPDRGGSWDFRELRLRSGGRELAIAYWFAVGPDRTANPVTAKLLEARTIISGEHIRPALIAVALDTKGLDKPGADLSGIAGGVARAMAACAQPAVPDAGCRPVLR